MKDRMMKALINEQPVSREEFDRSLMNELTSIHTFVTDMIKHPPIYKAISDAYWNNYLSARDAAIAAQGEMFPKEGGPNV